MATKNGSYTKQLKRVLGLNDLLAVAIGQIIGAGVMTLLGTALDTTGRSVTVAFLIAAVITICMYLPLVIVAGSVRLRGGTYTAIAMLSGQGFAGAFSVIQFVRKLSLSMYALSFASYFLSLFGVGTEKTVAVIVLTLFFVLNCLGIDKFAKAQNVIVIMLIAALAAFVAFGLPRVTPDFFAKDSWMTHGVAGLLQTAGLLTFSVQGANAAIDLSGEAKNPSRDIPIAVIAGTLVVTVAYILIAVVASGVLPIAEVSGQNLSVVANVIFSRPLYVFFILCGAGCAIASTLNGEFASGPKPIMQACDDGWFPAEFAKLSRFGTPVRIMSVMYVISMACILSGVSISILGSISSLASGVCYLSIAACVWKMPSVCPEGWEKSKFKCSMGALKFITALGVFGCGFNVLLNASRLDSTMLVINIVVIVAAIGYGLLRAKTVNMDISYEIPGEEG